MFQFHQPLQLHRFHIHMHVCVRRSINTIFVGFCFHSIYVYQTYRKICEKRRRNCLLRWCWQRVNQKPNYMNKKSTLTQAHKCVYNRFTRTCFNLCSSGFKLHELQCNVIGTTRRPVCMRTLNCALTNTNQQIENERWGKKDTKLWKGTAPKARNKSKTLTFSFVPFLLVCSFVKRTWRFLCF